MMEKPLDSEVQMIQRQNIKDFVLDIIHTLVPDYFWSVPASLSGKYHPAISLGEGGLVRHTKAAVWWGDELCRVRDIGTGDLAYDQIIAALILHDTMKNGSTMTHAGRATIDDSVRTHGAYLADVILNNFSERNQPVPAEFKDIVSGIRWHMGIWSAVPQPPESVTVVTQIVHLADYCASRKVDGLLERLSPCEP